MSGGESSGESGVEVHVAVAVLRDTEGRVLLTRRHADSHQGGLWEFPGGKVEAGESLPEALRREIHEELGLNVLHHEPLVQVRHDYGDKRVILDTHVVTEFSGKPLAREGQPMRWVPLVELPGYEFPAANVAIVEALLARG